MKKITDFTIRMQPFCNYSSLGKRLVEKDSFGREGLSLNAELGRDILRGERWNRILGGYLISKEVKEPENKEVKGFFSKPYFWDKRLTFIEFY